MSADKPKQTQPPSDSVEPDLSAPGPGDPPLAWDEPDPVDIFVLTDQSGWDALEARYPTDWEIPLTRCLEVARRSGAISAVVETRYIDLDYRSEYSAFYSRTFPSIPDSAHRIHFFSTIVGREALWDGASDGSYLGYVVVRPSELGRVGRTMLKPPPGQLDSVRAAVLDQVNLFGRALEVEGVPFAQQDTQLGRCAHAAAWVCHFSAHKRGDVARRAMAEFPLSANPGLGLGRPLPSGGLTVQQILELFRVFDLPAAFYKAKELPTQPPLPWVPDVADPQPSSTTDGEVNASALVSICCRYLNSGFPVLVGTSSHAFVLCGYSRTKRDGQDWITFIRHDDQRGLYLEIDDVLNDIDPATGDKYGPWHYLIVPLPDKLWLSAEAAESRGAQMLWALATGASQHVSETGLLLDLAPERLALRTYATTANLFKARLDRGLDPTLIREYRLARFSRYVWVVEAIDRELRSKGEPCVVGEVVLDATSSDTQPEPLAVHVPGLAAVHRTKGAPRFPIRCSPSPYSTGGVGPC